MNQVVLIGCVIFSLMAGTHSGFAMRKDSSKEKYVRLKSSSSKKHKKRSDEERIWKEIPKLYNQCKDAKKLPQEQRQSFLDQRKNLIRSAYDAHLNVVSLSYLNAMGLANESLPSKESFEENDKKIHKIVKFVKETKGYETFFDPRPISFTSLFFSEFRSLFCCVDPS